jgi:hypothetical protein
MDDFYYDDENKEGVDEEEESEEEIPLMAKLDINQLIKQGRGIDDANVPHQLTEAEQKQIDYDNALWASQFLGNHTMNQHVIDDKIKKGDVPKVDKRKKFVKKKIKFFS